MVRFPDDFPGEKANDTVIKSYSLCTDNLLTSKHDIFSLFVRVTTILAEHHAAKKTTDTSFFHIRCNFATNLAAHSR